MDEGKLVGNLFSDFFFRCINDVYRWNMRRLGGLLNKISRDRSTLFGYIN